MADNSNNKILNVPPLRFPEFTDEWEICKVSDLLDFYSTNSLSWDQLEYTGNGMRNLHYGLIHVGLPTLVDVGNALLPNIKEGFVPKNYQLCNNGDVAFADASEDTNEVAKVVEFTEIKDEKVVCGLHTIHGRDNKEKTVIGYKGYAFSSDAFHKQIRRIAQGTKIFSISTKNFSECYIGIPSIKEQTKIAKILLLLDRRIAVQTKIIEKYKSLIKGISKILMNGEPNVRLSECLESHSSTLQENQVAETGMYEVFGANGKCGYVDRPLIDGETILIVKDGSGVGNVMYKTGRYSVIGTLNYLTTNKSYCLKYLYFLLQNFNFEPYKTGMAIPHIYFKDYRKAKVYCPSLEEQKDITTKLEALESKIDTDQSFLKLLCLQKKYLLQQMLI